MSTTPMRANHVKSDREQVNPALASVVELARAAAIDADGPEAVGAHVGVVREDDASATHLFEARKPGYRGWQWAVTVAIAGPDEPVTISEVVLLPGPNALIAPEWLPWDQRVRAGDLGVGDLLPTAPDDLRLVPGYLLTGDSDVDALAKEIGLGRVRILSRFGRMEAAQRWERGEFGPHSEMAVTASATCGSCGFYQRLAGSLGAAFGACANELSPADGHVVHVEYGCGAHSEIDISTTSHVPVADLVYDDAQLDIEPLAT